MIRPQVVVVANAVKGEDVADFLPDAMPEGVPKAPHACTLCLDSLNLAMASVELLNSTPTSALVSAETSFSC
eukprot:3780097-Pleurochrysis_carterae.AAC.2